ncbi:MAG: zinc-binding dehydrogenase [Hungatella hathewayi]|uniref:zinc-dependent alcohol dehydrogenase n=1 Tax=Hungatella TaxID=1649459 RepID=UPI001106979C|nr:MULTISPECIES: zinc-binding dehydrogenase [Hungatella]MCI7382568.1 zinc-binding dehydrogenase [Hungatella sp.]MDY6235448.1 zinc-binding dehydrogenase [Hungatella hathewayi]
MKGLAVHENRKLQIVELPMPEYNEYQALVKVLACGICNGTDSKIIHGTFKGVDTYPILLGHEAVGKVVETGKHVKYLTPGDIVLLPFLYQKTEQMIPTWGGFCEYALVGDDRALEEAGIGISSPLRDGSYPAQSVMTSKDGIDPAEMVMVITFREVLSAIRRFGFRENESVLIYGAGPVGQCFIKFSKLLGMSEVICVDITDEKTAEAACMGADHVFNSRKTNVVREVRKLLPDGVDYVVDAVGLGSLINEAMELIADHGNICCYGISPRMTQEIDWSKAPYNWNLQFVQFPEKAEEAEAHSQIMAWIRAGVLNPKDFISDQYPFEKILEAFEKVEQHLPDTKKIVITYT